MFRAPAVMLLSMRSHTASGREYPVALSDSIRTSALGATTSNELSGVTLGGTVTIVFSVSRVDVRVLSEKTVPSSRSVPPIPQPSLHH